MAANARSAAVFLDRDGTLIEDRGFIGDLGEVFFLPGVFEALRRLQERFLLFIVTNQNPVLTERQISDVNDCVWRRLAEEGIGIERVYVCRHLKTEGCRCRKPSPYFLEQASVDYRIDLRRSFVIGDHPSDMQLAENAGAYGLYVLTGHGQKHMDELPERTEIVSGLAEAAERILSQWNPSPKIHDCQPVCERKTAYADEH